MGQFRISIVVMFATLMGSSLNAQPAPPPLEPANVLAELPGTNVEYYDVTGANVTEINRSIARQRPRSAKGNPVPANTDWSVRAEFDRTVTDGQCRVTAARANVTASADLPRLADDTRIDKPTRARWQDYVGLLEQNSIATLAFVYQNLGTVERAMLASDCAKKKKKEKKKTTSEIRLLRRAHKGLAGHNKPRLSAIGTQKGTGATGRRRPRPGGPTQAADRGGGKATRSHPQGRRDSKERDGQTTGAKKPSE